MQYLQSTLLIQYCKDIFAHTTNRFTKCLEYQSRYIWLYSNTWMTSFAIQNRLKKKFQRDDEVFVMTDGTIFNNLFNTS